MNDSSLWDCFIPAYRAWPIWTCAFLSCKEGRWEDESRAQIRRWCRAHTHLRNIMIAAEGGGRLIKLP